MDGDCIFCLIGGGEAESDVLYQDDDCFVIRDIAPKAPVHVLVIPKGKYVSFDDFAANAAEGEIAGLMRLCAEVCAAEGIGLEEGQGFRAISNAGPHGVQEVPHFHLHIMGGAPMGPMSGAR